MATQQQVIKTFMKSLDKTELSGRAALDEAIKASSDFKNYNEVYQKFMKDLLSAKNIHTFLVEKCGIILDDADTGAISGSNAGGTTKTATDLLPSRGEAQYPSGTSFTVDGLTIYGIPPKEELTADQQYIVSGLYSWWIRDALALIKESYGLSYIEADTTNARMKLKFIDDKNNPALAYVASMSLDGVKYESCELCVNMAHFKDVDPSDHHGVPFNGWLNLDRALTHELVHGIMASNIDYYGYLPIFLTEGGTAELIHGIDDFRREQILTYIKDPSVFGKILSPMFTDGIREVYSGGYIFMRYFAKQAATDTTFDYDTYKKTVSVKDNFAINYFDVVTMKGGSGNDTIVNSGLNVSIAAGKGNDTVKNYSDNVTVNGGSGKNYLYNEGAKVSIIGGADKDSVTNFGSKVSVSGGAGVDSINNYGSKSVIDGGTGNDLIYNGTSTLNSFSTDSLSGTNATIYGGDGIDTIKNSADNVKIYGDNDNDSLYNEGDSSTVYGGDGADIIQNKGEGVKIYGKNDNDSLYNEGASAIIYGGAAKDTITNTIDGESSTLNGGDDNDNLINYGDESSLFGGAGEDTLYSSGDDSTLNGGAGDDSIKSEGINAEIFGGSGNDTIRNYGDNITISGGKGNDSIKNDGGRHIVYEFGKGGGKDTVFGFNANDTVQITNGKYSAKKSGKDVIVNVGSDTMTLKNAASKSIHFISASGKEKTKTYSTITANPSSNTVESADLTTQQGVIKTFMQSLDKTTLSGTAALNEAIQASSDFDNYGEVANKFLNDFTESENCHTFLVEKCGIILDNEDTGAISGSDAGGTKKTATDILPCEGEAKYPSGTSFTVDGLTIYGIPPKEKLTADQQYIVSGLYSWWIRDALALIKESYGFSFSDENTTNARLRLKFIDDESSDIMASVTFTPNDDFIKCESRDLVFNMAHFRDVDPSNHHGIPSDGGKNHLDRTLVHELTHGIMASNINYFNDLPNFLVEGGSAELIHGIDDFRRGKIIEFIKDKSSAGESLAEILKPIDQTGDYSVYVGGYLFMRYFAKQAAATTFDYDTYSEKVSVKDNFATNYFDNVTMTGGKGNDTISNSGLNVSIAAGKGNDTVRNYSDTVTINGGSGNDFIQNVFMADDFCFEGVSIFGGSGKDTISNFGSKISINGGVNSDSIENYGSHSVIDGGEGNDFISNIVSDTISGANSTIYGGDGIDTIENSADNVKIYGDNDNDSLYNEGNSSTVYGGDGSDIIQNKGEGIKIYGDADNDTISNSGAKVTVLGGAGVDSVNNTGDGSSINGGAGADKLTNNSDYSNMNGGADNDSIINYGNNSSINGDKGNDTLYSSGRFVEINGGEGNDSIKNEGIHIEILGGSGNDTIHNYGDHITISGGKDDDYIKNSGGKDVVISGGAGNDKITNTGKHTVYEFGTGDGKDSIIGFNTNDTVKITSGTYNSSQSGKNVIVKVGDATLTLKNAVGKKISFISASGKKTSKTYSAKLKKETAPMWFIDDDNFATSDNLSSIVKGKEVSANYLELETSTNLTKKNTLATFSGKKK